MLNAFGEGSIELAGTAASSPGQRESPARLPDTHPELTVRRKVLAQ